MKISSRLLFLVLTICSLTSCIIKEPEGPAEQIGKGVDMIGNGMQQYDRDARERDEAYRREHGGASSSASSGYDRDGNYKGSRDDTFKSDGGYVPSEGDFDSRADSGTYHGSDPVVRAPTHPDSGLSDDDAREQRRY